MLNRVLFASSVLLLVACASDPYSGTTRRDRNLITTEEIAAEPQDPLPMVRIALRNVRRLHRTLEWSQDVLALADMPHAVAIDALMILAANRPGTQAESPAEPAVVIPFAAAEPVG